MGEPDPVSCTNFLDNSRVMYVKGKRYEIFLLLKERKKNSRVTYRG